MNNFTDVPKDKGTRIIEQEEIIINGIPGLKQHWSWDGIIADSLIFNSKDVEHLSDNESLQEFINDHTDIKVTGSVTFKRNSNGYCFVNFNFEVDWLRLKSTGAKIYNKQDQINDWLGNF